MNKEEETVVILPILLQNLEMADYITAKGSVYSYFSWMILKEIEMIKGAYTSLHLIAKSVEVRHEPADCRNGHADQY